jgi:hypothetical protein
MPRLSRISTRRALRAQIVLPRNSHVHGLARAEWEKLCTCFVISSCSSRGKVAKVSNLVPIRNGMAVLLKPRACRYHSLTEFNVDFRDRSNMKSSATASLQTSGSMLTNSRWPPKSHMEKVIVVRRTEMVFSMKLTPAILTQPHPAMKMRYDAPSVWM